ncbi:MAG: VCBS repeat-containing protein, partial [Gammaproteobacteria bacterium]|nr:VCBS repeat-containing protein [Gammaproteobacteria bacterium]
GTRASPNFVDIDDDGDFDAFFGENDGTLIFYRNTGSTDSPVFSPDALPQTATAANPLDGVDAGTRAVPSFTDIDKDGDLDLFFGEDGGTLKFYENSGSPTAPVFSPAELPRIATAANPLDGVDAGTRAVPSFTDIDNDGDMDVFLGENDGTLKFYENSGSAASPLFVPAELPQSATAANPLDWVDVGTRAAPYFTDIDADGDLDLFFGANDGLLYFYENNGSVTAPNFVTGSAAAMFQPLAEFGLAARDIPTLDADAVKALDPAAFSAFDAENVAALSISAVSGLSAAQLTNLAADALNGLTPGQFQSIPDLVLRGLTAKNIGGLPVDVIAEFTPEDISALNINDIRQAEGRDIARMLTNFACDITPEQAAVLAPPDWQIDLSSGIITVPPGSGLGFNAIVQDVDLTGAVSLPELPDLGTVFGIGACRDGTTLLAEFNQTLDDMGLDTVEFSQQKDGIVSITTDADEIGGTAGLDLRFIPVTKNIVQVGEEVKTGISVDKNGRYLITITDKKQFPLTPAPADPAGLAAAMGTGGSIKLGESGDVLLKFKDSLRQASWVFRAVIFDPFIEPAPAGICIDISFGNVQCNWAGVPPYQQPGIHLFSPFSPFSRAGTDGEESRAVYNDGTSQKIYLTVLSPETFEEKMREIEGVENITFKVTDGSFNMVYRGRSSHLSADLDSRAVPLAEGVHIEPEITISLDGDRLEYTVQSEALAITSTVRVSPPIHGVIPLTDTFVNEVLALGANAVIQNTDNTFDIWIPGQRFLVTPTFEVRIVESDEPADPQPFTGNSDATLTYAVRMDTQIVRTKLLLSEKQQPAVPFPEHFIEKMLEITGVESVTPAADGGFDVVFSGTPVKLTPTFDVQTRKLAEGEQIKPPFYMNDDGTLSYTVQDGSWVTTTRLHALFL